MKTPRGDIEDLLLMLKNKWPSQFWRQEDWDTVISTWPKALEKYPMSVLLKAARECQSGEKFPPQNQFLVICGRHHKHREGEERRRVHVPIRGPSRNPAAEELAQRWEREDALVASLSREEGRRRAALIADTVFSVRRAP